MSEAKPSITLPEQAKVLQAFGATVRILQSGEQTGGKFTSFIDETAPGGGPPPHWHDNEDEWFLPLKGSVEFFLNGDWQEVPLGTSVFVPKGTVHTFRNCGDEPLELLIHTMPSGFEVFFERCAEVFAEPGPPDMDRLVAIAAEHGIHFVEA